MSNPEIMVAVDRRRAADLGVRMSTVGDTLRLMVSGDEEISIYHEGQRAVSGEDPRAREPAARPRDDRKADGRLDDERPGPRWTTSPGSNAASDRASCSALTANSRPILSADVAPGHALDEASNDVRKLIAGSEHAARLQLRLRARRRFSTRRPTNLIMAIALACIFVYMVLAAQFESFVQPIIIMLVLPLSVPFALLHDLGRRAAR